MRVLDQGFYSTEPIVPNNMRIGHAMCRLREAVAEIWKLRMENDTADLMLAEEAELFVECSKLKIITDDIIIANDNGRV